MKLKEIFEKKYYHIWLASLVVLNPILIHSWLTRFRPGTFWVINVIFILLLLTFLLKKSKYRDKFIELTYPDENKFRYLMILMFIMFLIIIISNILKLVLWN